MNGQFSGSPLAIYLHIPYCIRKCAYCDFLSFPLTVGAWQSTPVPERYVSALIGELTAQAPLYAEYAVRSIYFGGGTPSLLSVAQVGRILDAIRLNYNCPPEGGWNGAVRTGGVEVSLEANPGTLTMEKAAGYRAAGINRLSIGLQSACDEELAELGRIHTWEQFLEGWEIVRSAGYGNVNVDLMSGLPGQTAASWRHTLEQVALLAPEHISAYGLILEEGTAFWDRYGTAGSIASAEYPPLPGEDAEVEMLEWTREYLTKCGYIRYEISNYARPGHACRHNITYWRRGDYAGFGLGAASLRRHARWTNTSVMDRYLEYAGLPGLRTPGKEDFHILSGQEEMEEFMFLGLRMTEGISPAAFQDAFGESVDRVYGQALASLPRQGLLERTGAGEEERIRLTEYGLDVSNVALAEFLF